MGENKIHEQTGNGTKIPLQCVLHGEALEELRHNMRDVKLAVCGDTDIGISGLVKDVADLKDWRRRIDLRVAWISGATALAVFIGKWILEKL
jgi:hypothetical protein